MKKLAFLAISVAALAAPAVAQTVETGTTDWDKLPAVKMGSDDIDYNRLVRWAATELAKPECKATGMRPTKFDIDEPYAVLVEPSGNVTRIVVREMGCPGLNTVIGSTLADLAKRGKFRATGQSQPYWYGGRLSFAASEQVPR